MAENAFPQTHAGILDALEFLESEVAGDNSDVLDRALLVAGEVLANAVEHGGEHADQAIVVGIQWADRQLVMTIQEPERTVSQESLGSAALPDDPFATSGRGLFLIKTLADTIQPVDPAGYRYAFRVREAS